MRAFDLALEMYDGDEEAIQRIIMKCAKVGGVYIDNDCFICGYPTHSSLIEIQSKKALDKPDTWFIYIAIGNMKKAFSMFERKEYICFERFDKKYRLYSFDKVRHLIWEHQTRRKFQIRSQK